MIKMNISRLILSQEHDSFPALDQVPAIQRRRLSFIAKLALNSAIDTLANDQVDYIIWASQYGDEHKTLKILSDVVQDQAPSPTQFSTSVHNAISGLYSILRVDPTPSTSLASSWNDALIEAYAWLKTSAKHDAKVLVVYYDESLPEIYKEYESFDAFALAAICTLGRENFELNLSKKSDEKASIKDALDFYHFWMDETQLAMQAWQKC